MPVFVFFGSHTWCKCDSTFDWLTWRNVVTKNTSLQLPSFYPPKARIPVLFLFLLCLSSVLLPLPSLHTLNFDGQSREGYPIQIDIDLFENMSDTLMPNLFCAIFFALKLVNFLNATFCLLSVAAPLTFMKWSKEFILMPPS